MVRACAGLSCMTSHSVGTCLCHSFSALKSPSLFWADLASRRTLVWPKDEPRFEVVVASNNPAVNALWVNGVEKSCTRRLGKDVRPARRTSVENCCVCRVLWTLRRLHPGPWLWQHLPKKDLANFFHLGREKAGKIDLTVLYGQPACCFWCWMTTNEEMESARLFFIVGDWLLGLQGRSHAVKQLGNDWRSLTSGLPSKFSMNLWAVAHWGFCPLLNEKHSGTKWQR